MKYGCTTAIHVNWNANKNAFCVIDPFQIEIILICLISAVARVYYKMKDRKKRGRKYEVPKYILYV